MGDDPAKRLRENVTGVTATVLTGLWLALLLGPWGGQLWLPVLIVSYVVIVPLVALLFGDEEDVREWWDDDEIDPESIDEDSETTDGRDALEKLRDRYAAGELTDDQFERKLERLLETETLEGAEQWRRDARRERDRDLEYER